MCLPFKSAVSYAELRHSAPTRDTDVIRSTDFSEWTPLKSLLPAHWGSLAVSPPTAVVIAFPNPLWPVGRIPPRPVPELLSSTYLLTYLLTPWNRVLLEKLTGFQPVKKFPALYGTRRFIIALTSARHLSLSWASPIQSSYPDPTSWRSILILSSHLRLGLPTLFILQ